MSNSGSDGNGDADYEIVEGSNGAGNHESLAHQETDDRGFIDSREDMFVDAPEEVNGEEEEDLEEKEGVEVRQVNGVENGVRDDGYLVAELERLRSQLEKTAGEKDNLEGDKDVLLKELYVKDQEIEELNAKISELSGSSEVVKVAAERSQYVESVVERILSALGSVFGQDLMLNDSGGGKVDVLERSSYLLIEQYHKFLYELEQLRQTVTTAESDPGFQGDFPSVFATVQGGFHELRRKEVELTEKISYLEDENRKLLDQVEKEKATVLMVNAELGKTKTEVEQEKTRCANTKEKLSMAVTKGKALVQQRDSLKQALAEKTRELERCLVELQSKSSALEAAELSKEEFAKGEHLAASLQDALSQKSLIVETFEHTLAQVDVPEELDSVDIVGKARWLVNERNTLKAVSLDFYKLKDVISSIDIPENILISDLETRITWLKESFYQAKDEIIMLQDEIARTREGAHNEIERLSASASAELQEKLLVQQELDDLRSIYTEVVEKAQQLSVEKDHLSASFLAELQEKDYIQKELEELSGKYEIIAEKEKQVSLEKENIVRKLVEDCGLITEDQEGSFDSFSNLPILVDRCLGKIKEQINVSTDGPQADSESLERLQGLLYVREQELMLYKEISDQDIVVRSQLNDKLDELRIISQELVTLKEDKDVLQKDLERSEEKSAVLREKLTMAVKKGKGLVQDRENLKSLLDEKKSEIEKLKRELQQQDSIVAEGRDEIEKLKLELQQQDSIVAESRDEIRLLSNDLDRIPKLETDLSVMKDERDQFEKFLSESNSMLRKVMESIERIVLPVDSVFEEPIEKVNWLAEYIDNCQHAKTQAEEEFSRVKEEADSMGGKLAEALATIKSLEDALAVSENNISQYANQKRELDLVRENIEQELQRAIEDARSQSTKFVMAAEAKESLEKELSLAENNISILTSEKEEAQASQAAAEMELEKARGEIATQSSKLAEAFETMRSLENALSQAETNIAVLTEQNNKANLDKTNLESELQVLKDEADTFSGKLADAAATIKSLEDKLAKAENDFSVLEGEKRSAEEEVSLLNSKLSACMEELNGNSGSLASRSVELVGHINDLQVLVKDESLLSTVKQCFARNLNGLKDMDLTIKHIRGHLLDSISVGQLNHSVEETAHVAKFLSYDLDGDVEFEMDNGDANSIDGGDISSCFRKTAEGLQMRDKFITDKLEDFSNCIEDSVAALLKELMTIENQMVMTVDQVESLKDRVKSMEMCEQEKGILKNENAILMSACTDATRVLQFEMKNKLLELSSVPELEKFNHGLLPEMVKLGENGMAGLGDDVATKTAEKLLASTGQVLTLVKLFESTTEVAALLIQDLQKELKDTKAASEEAVEERDLYERRISELETGTETLQDSCHELKLKLEDYEAREVQWKEKEMELSNMYNNLLAKEQEVEDPILSASQVRILLERISEIEVPFLGSEVEDLDPHGSANVKKLFYVIDSITGLQDQINKLSHENEDLQSTLSSKILEIEHLKEEIGMHIEDKDEREKMKGDLFELTLALEKIDNMLGGKGFTGDPKPSDLRGLLPVVEKQVTALLLENENSKSKVQELGIKLLGSQKALDELSTKVKLLEDSLEGRTSQSEIVQERSIFEAPSAPTGSEISEIEDAGPLGKTTISPAPSAAQVRTLRKGSTDHLALTVDSESDLLISNEDIDRDKGHVLKSLNASGLIPKQGKLIADRVDGFWVTGGRVLSSRPRARLGLIAYCLLIHIWLLGTIV